MEARAVTLVLVVYCTFASAQAAGDEIADLVDKKVLYAGKFEPVFCPPSGKYDCRKQPYGLLRTENEEICFTTSLSGCSIYCKGLIAAGYDNKPYLYLIESIGGDIKKGAFAPYACPSRY